MWLHWVVYSSSHYSGSQPSVKWQEWQSAPPSLTPWSSEKTSLTHHIKYLEACSCFREEGSERLTDRPVMQVLHESVVVKREPKMDGWEDFEKVVHDNLLPTSKQKFHSKLSLQSSVFPWTYQFVPFRGPGKVLDFIRNVRGCDKCAETDLSIHFTRCL